MVAHSMDHTLSLKYVFRANRKRNICAGQWWTIPTLSVVLEDINCVVKGRGPGVNYRPGRHMHQVATYTILLQLWFSPTPYCVDYVQIYGRFPPIPLSVHTLCSKA
ncbi:hypothetical protein PoB_002511900 [Plakobranchus ocellatus]|uniref:Uncharacterized protein n=1 Tax=Plakobranchus ocellatus TaxID=259542 RepID=A0AAV3ZVZ5_9GAST|nr:hypothetical protein PoB_002511900 [Plakobranchus ocellatus]